MPAQAEGKPAARALSAPQKALHRLGLVRDIDLALHLPQALRLKAMAARARVLVGMSPLFSLS